uniref:J domain-containing protein n=1 Tax=Aotus nancymaae TaxID=37293 RepID=A0A2K5BYY0_AOTNA
MVASGESRTSGDGDSTEEAFMTNYKKRDSVLTSKNQIERLTRLGYSYFNLNPFEVFQLDPEVTDEEIKKMFQQLSIWYDSDRAQKAFEAVDKAYQLLLGQEQKKRALDVIQAGKEYSEEKKKVKEGKPTTVGEDDPELFKQALETKRKERKAKGTEEEIEAQEKAKRDREWQKNFEESRDGRIDSWPNFQANTKGKKERKNQTFLRPPKVKIKQHDCLGSQTQNLSPAVSVPALKDSFFPPTSTPTYSNICFLVHFVFSAI